tara:strand:+ start:364 stop:549 length:186 start_codon:yes stop_codon:yes gene_type:complete
MTPEEISKLNILAHCTDCKQDEICYRRGCRGKFLNRDGSWKKPYLTPLDQGGIYFDSKSLK